MDVGVSRLAQPAAPSPPASARDRSHDHWRRRWGPHAGGLHGFEYRPGLRQGAIKGAETIFDDKLGWHFRVDATIGAGR
jgi:hypothetical protein